MTGEAVYFLAGLVAGLAIAWYLTRQHYELKATGKNIKKDSAVPDKQAQSAISSSEEEDEKSKD
ncbi:MAG: hypothetical protein R6V49_01765 [Bacteroidales bacterium]